MRTARTICVAAAVLFLSATAIMAQGEKVAMKRAWPPGNYVMTQTETSQSEQMVGNQPVKSNSSSTSVWELTVGEPNEKGEKKIAAKVVKHRLSEEGDTAYSYNSEAPAQEQDKDLAFVFGALLGTPVEITLDADDAVVEVSGLDKLWTDLLAKATTDTQKGLIAQESIELADKTVEQSLRHTESIVPTKDVAVGDKWTAGIRIDLPLVGEVKQRFDCSLKGVEDSPAGKLAVIQVEAKYESTKPRPGNIQGQEITVSKLEASEKGDVKFDLATGIAASDEKTMTVSAVLDTTDEKGKPLKVTVKANNSVTTTIAPAGKADVTPPEPTQGTAAAPKS